MILPAIKQIAQTEMGDRRSGPGSERGDKYTHGERVATLAVRLRQIIFPGESGYDDILTVAAWFHDILNGVGDRSLHSITGAARSRELLSGNCTEEELDLICGIIAVHDDRNPGENTYSNTLKLHQDADHLDHFGTFEIWRLVANTAGHNETINDASKYLQFQWPDDNARWRDELNFEISRAIFDSKTEFVKAFIERFAVESVGGIWNEEMILAGIDGSV